MSNEPTTDIALTRLMNRYALNGRPIRVHFRKLVNWIPYNSERATHSLHPYPAKLLLHIPHFFLSNSVLSKRGDLVLDPFCGTGTVLLESVLKGRKAMGADSNPLACLISKVKTKSISPAKLISASNLLFRRIANVKADNRPSVVNLEKWFYPHVIDKLCKIRKSVSRVRDESIKDYFSICLSMCARRVSLADPRVSVPVRLRAEQYPAKHPLREQSLTRLRRLKSVNVFRIFEEIVRDNNVRLLKFSQEVQEEDVQIFLANAKTLRDFTNNKYRPDLVITSPPYAGAQKYIRASSLSLGWLDLCAADNLRSLEQESIGREHYHKADYKEPLITGIKDADRVLKSIRAINPLRAHIASNYLCEMKQALESTMKMLKPQGYMVLIAGNNYVCGKQFKTAQYLKHALVNLGGRVVLELVDDIKSRGLMTKRNKTANIITRETVIILQKG